MQTAPLASLLLLLLGADCGGTKADVDADGDGYKVELDCDDADPAVNPGEAEIPYDHQDNDCASATPDDDLDEDGFPKAQDCDDANPAVHPGAVEACDGEDDDCDGVIDNNTGPWWYEDTDGDGWGDPDRTAQACDGTGGFVADGSDCDDTRATVHPGADESCNDRDDDCDGLVDDAPTDAPTWYADADADGYGDPASPSRACEAPAGHGTDATDCDDTTPAIHPGAVETCNEMDDDCDGLTDEAGAIGASTWYVDADGDGWGDPGSPITACNPPDGTTPDDQDCDDSRADIHPGASETWYDGYDADCGGGSDFDQDRDGQLATPYGGTDCDDTDPAVYAGATETWYDGIDQDCDGTSDLDQDGDGWNGTAAGGDDCDDLDTAVHPGAADTWYDGVDQDCDGTNDWDADADGYRSAAYGGVDCDDTDDDTHPGADERCDGADDDCDGSVDETDAVDAATWYRDGDGDGFGDAAVSRPACDAPTGYVADATDCDDTNARVFPGAPEVDPTVDNDCDGEVEAMPEAVALVAPSADLLTCTELPLDASHSSDPAGEALTFAWEVTSVPTGSALVTDDLTDPTSATPSCWPDVAGLYVFTVTVTDPGGATDSATTTARITARTTNTPPTASAGADTSTAGYSTCMPISYGASYDCAPCTGHAVYLDASGSTDADGEPLTPAWTTSTGGGTLDDPTAAQPVFTCPDQVATYGSATTDTWTVTLTVTDCMGATATDTVEVTCSCTGV